MTPDPITIHTTHIVRDTLPGGVHTYKEVKTLKTLKPEDCEWLWTTPFIEYKDSGYYIGTDDYTIYVAMVGLKEIHRIEASSCVEANQKARQRIDELYQDNAVRIGALRGVETVHPEPEPTPKRRSRRKKLEPITKLPEADDIAEEEEAHVTPEYIAEQEEDW